MNNPLAYIEEAIKSGSSRVKVVVNGVVTEADPKVAIVELRKTKNMRNGYWSFAQPFEDAIHGDSIVKPTIVEEPEEQTIEPIEEEVTKKKKKTSEQSNES